MSSAVEVQHSIRVDNCTVKQPSKVNRSPDESDDDTDPAMTKKGFKKSARKTRRIKAHGWHCYL